MWLIGCTPITVSRKINGRRAELRAAQLLQTKSSVVTAMTDRPTDRPNAILPSLAAVAIVFTHENCLGLRRAKYSGFTSANINSIAFTNYAIVSIQHQHQHYYHHYWHQELIDFMFSIELNLQCSNDTANAAADDDDDDNDDDAILRHATLLSGTVGQVACCKPT